ncbi:UDP-glucose 4-epimerase family protein [Laribacter hongkongensis]|uniref:UDP-glucose 4-epimerase family protein n=1 Tax=Laribacter hongkongensis TaxID=168471 RepID=UPI001EFE0381|nr:SDR family oxidoreductase [Laribacter hongkongensis]MCG9095339.1 SDR family oxidoreductase [Laribacter hongkongensis]
MRIAVSGANGFVGHGLVRQLAANNHQLLAYVRQPGDFARFDRVTTVAAPELDPHSDWQFRHELGIDVLVHLAARVHVMKDTSADPLTEFRKVNVAGTANLARQAAKVGVKRFVFLSSIKVNGEFMEAGQPFTTDDVPAPEDPYGVSKHEAEQLLRQIAAETGMEIVIIRPPLVYGPGVKANFESMMRWLARDVPLPLAAVTNNRRSLVALDNLVDLIVTCLNHPAAANQTFLVSDDEDLSTADLLKRMGAAMEHPARLFHLPPALLKLGATVLNKPGIYQRLCGSLQLDITKTRQLLGWTPPVSVDEGLRRAAEGFRL